MGGAAGRRASRSSSTPAARSAPARIPRPASRSSCSSTSRRGAILDIGCGSGVVSIAAAKLGFAPVTAVDIDEVAVEVTRANARANGVEIDVGTADVRRSGLETPGLPAPDLAVANISLELVQVAAAAIDADRLVTAGYLAADRPELPGYAPGSPARA